MRLAKRPPPRGPTPPVRGRWPQARGGRDAVAVGDWGRIQVTTLFRPAQHRRGGACPSRTSRSPPRPGPAQRPAPTGVLPPPRCARHLPLRGRLLGVRLAKRPPPRGPTPPVRGRWPQARGGRDAVAVGDWGRILVTTLFRPAQHRRGGACPSRTGRSPPRPGPAQRPAPTGVLPPSPPSAAPPPSKREAFWVAPRKKAPS